MGVVGAADAVPGRAALDAHGTVTVEVAATAGTEVVAKGLGDEGDIVARAQTEGSTRIGGGTGRVVFTDDGLRPVEPGAEAADAVEPVRTRDLGLAAARAFEAR